LLVLAVVDRVVPVVKVVMELHERERNESLADSVGRSDMRSPGLFAPN
jgi:hypothetical protein